MTNESISGTFVRSPQDPPIIDQWGNAWTISARGQVVIDGQPDAQTANVTELAYFNRLVWQWVASKQLWWSKAGFAAPWLPPSGTPNAPFGPTPDPRIDALQASVNAFAAQLAQAVAMLGGAIQNVQNDVDELPTEMIPDPRIDALAGAVATLSTQTFVNLAAISTDIDALSDVVQSGQAVARQRLDLVETQLLTAQATQDAAALQLERIIVMLLSLFPPNLQTHITTNLADLKVSGTQPAPLAPGP